MSGKGQEIWMRKFFSLTATALLVVSTVLVGISLNAPNASAGPVTLNKGNLWVEQLSDFGRILKGFTWNAQPQDIRDPVITYSFHGLVLDQDNYDHTPGSENIADSYFTWPYFAEDDLEEVTASTFLINDATTQKSFATFKNSGVGTGDPNDILINQTCWSVVNKDWAILQWTLYNIKSVDINNVALGLELSLSHALGPNGGVGGDNGDDIDGYDAVEGIYWAQDNTGVTIGFGSAIISDPFTHYYSADYHNTYTWDQYKALYTNDTWLYNRLHAPSSVVGATPGNRSSTIGWDGFTLSPGTPRTLTLVVAVNSSYPNVVNAIKDAQYYYRNVATGFLVTEFSDDSTTQRIEVYNNGREPTDLVAAGYDLSNDDGATYLTGTWNPTTIPTYGYSIFTVTGTPIGPEGDSISLWQDPGGGYKLVDGPFAFGQEGTVPDPLEGGSAARRFDTSAVAYTNDWLQTAVGGATWGSQNNVGYRIASPPVVLNRVMFNPYDITESYIEVRYKGITILVDNYKIVCDDTFVIPPGNTLSASNPFFVLTYLDAPTLFASMTTGGDNVYLYNSAGNLLDMVGWSSAHTQGYFMGRMPESAGTTQGFSDTTSVAAGWVFDHQPTMMITEIAADTPTTAKIEIYNPRGGDKVPTAGIWDLDCGAGPITGSWAPNPIPAGGYSVFTQSAGGNVNLEGDTFTLTFDSSVVVDSVGFGSNGPAPDPLTGESSGRYWDSGAGAYTGDWNRNASTGPTWGAQNDVPAVLSSAIVFQEVMFYPTIPAGHFIIIFNTDVAGLNIEDWKIVSDSVYTLSDDFGSFLLGAYTLYIFRYNDLGATFQAMCDALDTPEDNLYMYDGQGRRIDMVGWNTAHFQGMSVKRDPMGNGTRDGYDDATSEAASWVFNSPLDVILTEISDDGGSSQIELYNFWYPTIDFSAAGYIFENRTGATMTGTWIDSTAGAGEYAVLDVDPGFMDDQGDVVSFVQNGILIDELGYGQYGTVPDPLDGVESVQRIYDPALLVDYEDIWSRNVSSGPNFGFTNDVPDDNLSSPIVLNEVNFNPLVAGDFFIELYNKGGAPVDISGWRIVGDKEYVIPMGTVLDLSQRYFYLLYSMDPSFFALATFDSAGDNLYLYNQDGSIVDMVGWNTIHTVGETMSRVPEGNGTMDGYDDTSSIAAGWRFGQTPTVRLISVEIAEDSAGSVRTNIKYGHFGTTVTFNLTISNFQATGDTIDILNSSQEGWPVEVLDAGGTIKIDNIFINPDGSVNITLIITMPDSIPFAIMDNITIIVRSTNSTIIGDSITLNVRVYPFLNLTKSADPTTIYMNGTGHDEVTTITLNLTGLGAQVAVRRYLDVVFCIDSSGSMGWNDPLDLRKTESQNFVANYFENPDRGAVVDFDEDAILVNNHHLSNNYPQIINDLSTIDSNGGTDLSNGLNLSNAEMAQFGQLTTKVPVIICLTDAESLPFGDDTESLAEADYSAAMGVIIMTIGLTIPPNGTSELLLKEIANRTGGIYYRAENAGFFASIYENISSFLTDLAVWDNDTSDPNPLVRDVLPPYIRLNGTGNFGGDYPPTLIDQNGPGGTTIIEWNLQWIKLGQTVTFTFEVVSNVPGFVMTNVYDESRAFYTTWDNSTDIVYFPEVWINVLPPSPIPPALHIETLPGGDDIYLWWDEPFIPGTEYYLLYRSTTPTGFDFSTPWKITNVHADPLGGLNPTRLSWNHTGAADPIDPEWAEQYYYCLRSVNGLGETSYSSNTVGKWTRNFAAGNATFSFPLEPLVPETAEYYTQDMNARFIKWIDPGTRTWVQHDQGEVGDDTVMEVGKGYEVDFAAPTRYTFLGHPGAMIRYKTDSTVGFDYATEADSLSASVNPITGDVTLNWAIPASIGNPGDQYYIYSSTSRDGFHGTKGVDYTLLAINIWTTTTFIDAGAATAGTQWHYMVIPANSTGVEGASTYSIGVWTSDIMPEYDTIAIPLQLTGGDQTADWYSTNIDNTVGINYFMYTDLRWGWHSERMPSGAFDPTLIMTEGYQISTSGSTKFSFIGH